VLAALVALAAASCSGAARPPRSAPAAPSSRSSAVDDGHGQAVVWDYQVTVDPALDLDVRASFRGPIAGELRVDAPATAFIERLELEDHGIWKKAALDDARWRDACATTCTFRYRVRLREAAKAIADVDVAMLSGGAVFAPPSTWLVRPSQSPAGRYRFHVATTPPVRFATGIRAAARGDDTYEAAASSIDEAAFAAVGPLRIAHVAEPAIDAVLAPDLALSDDVVAHWLRAEATAIGSYFGHAPDGHAMLFIVPGHSADTGGKTLGGGGASLLVSVGTRVTPRNLEEDWVVAHELVHVAFPDLDRRYSWFSEGLATYVEPIARARTGLVKSEKVWADMIEGLPQGLPRRGDSGLDGTREWGRLYWGGALYFFLADIRIHERTGGARSLRDALRAVVATGGNVESMWPLARVIEVGDAATGTKVLRELHEELGTSAGSVDLAALFRRLGVRLEGGVVRFDDGAPLAAVRDAILPRAAAR
jgi:predicted metalloprotease with PDZ domain